MGQENDWSFMDFIQRELRAGKTRIEIPGGLLQDVSDEVLKEARSLVKLSGAKISAIDMS